MIKRLNNSKGITLIALVITIIVLLILAGVAISMLNGENGILNQASKAKNETKRASTEELVKLAAMSALTTGEGKIQGEDAFATLNKELKDAGYEGETITELPTVVTIEDKDYIISTNGATREATGVEKYIGKEVTGSKVTLTDENGDTIVVPVGFTIKSDSPTIVDRGIVVVAPDSSEFVWVPVENATTMYGTNLDGVKLGKLYDFSSSGYNALNWTETEGVMSWTNATDFREPDYLPSTNLGDASTTSAMGLNLLSSILGIEGTVGTDDETMLSTWSNQLQNEFNEMIKSVEENKGFYVGRYETSLNETGNAQSISGATSATAASDSANTWYGLYQREKEYSSKNNLTEVVGSSMMWGSQYDQMMIWMQGNGIDVTSITLTNLEGITTSKNTSRTTGTVETDKLNNIYDLLGNSYEWTLEASITDCRVFRGGSNGSKSFPSVRYYNYPFTTGSDFSSRFTLYIK